MSNTTTQRPRSQSTGPSPMRAGHTTVDSRSPTGAPTSRHDLEDSKHTARLGTFADGQRVVPLTVVYSENVSSFGSAE